MREYKEQINAVLYHINKLLRKDQVFENAQMSKFTSFKAGGIASALVTPETALEIASLREICKQEEMPSFLIGNGTNLLVKDSGYHGIIIKIGDGLEKCKIQDENIIVAEAGASLTKIARFAAAASLTGLEFASGIPGSVGGAVYMNAGAYDGEIKDSIVEAECLDNTGKIIHLNKDEMKLSYRHSIFCDEDLIILGARFELQKGNEAQILAKMKELNKRRNEKQPINWPSAGSVFKRPEGTYAGKLIDEAGLKGYRHGGAMISDLHSGFIINESNATATEILELIEIIREEVFETSKIWLEPEIKILG